MKHLFLAAMLCGMSFMATAQNTSVEQSTYGIQIGLFGVWAHNEAKLTNSLVFRSELGFDSGIWGGTYYEKTGFLMTPVITIEPKWYYNLNSRSNKSKNIDGNSGNFISLRGSYHPDWFVISNYDNVRVISDVSIIPTWGIRRNLGRHFNFETGIGLGYRYIFASSAGYSRDESELAGNLHLRIGYRF
ncbi:hypothetical protein [Mangrovimonas sp. YM274]|uniref:hypothetical protein n=1 Tax=Mangrovimonas sp. YM274 TaxID=3070660 RepID=UPI0027DCBE8E|nr:hypothetical protein [Mangrovimonas sp. YM274]WMI69056.1 hypothetical protein RBH95_01485 [Mangrovimonas sp. YM274]